MKQTKRWAFVTFGTSLYFVLSFYLQEFGGYFIVNGNERLIRMLMMTRRNYVSINMHDINSFT